MHQEKGVDVQAPSALRTIGTPAHAGVARARVTAEEIAEAHAANGERELATTLPTTRASRAVASR